VNSVTTRAVERRKAHVYSRGDYGTYWIVDPQAQRLEVRSGPTADGEYSTTRLLGSDPSVELPGLNSSLSVDDLLPPQR
jgi:Uma2 family endonuclease